MRTARELQKLQTPEEWPALPPKHSHKIEAAVILAQRPYYTRTGPIRVFLTNMFNGVDKNTPYTDFPTAEAIIEAGWVVD